MRNAVSGSKTLGELVDHVKRSVTEVESIQGRVDARQTEGSAA